MEQETEYDKHFTAMVRRHEKIIFSVCYFYSSDGVTFEDLQQESLIDHRLAEHDHRLDELTDKVDFFVKASLPPVEGVFFNGQIFDAYKFVCDLVKSAKKRIVLIDNYVDESVLTLFDKRRDGVEAIIYTDADRSRQIILVIKDAPTN